MIAQLIERIDGYHPASSVEAALQRQIIQFIRANPDNCLLRSNLVAHLTASGWIVDQQTRSMALLVKHAKLNLWLQPGGHADGDADLKRVALNEVLEETGLIVAGSDEIFDLDVHLIPLYKEVPPHLHLDVRFLFEGDSSLPLKISDESHDIRWVSFDEIATLGVDQSVLRMVEKSRGLKR